MAGLTDYQESLVGEHFFRNSSQTPVATLYFALFTAAPSDAGGGTEVTGGSYARIAKTAATNGFGAFAAGVASNVETIDFGTASANWGTITHMAIFDALTVGNMMAWGALAVAKTVNSADGISFLAGSVVLTID